MFDLLIRGGTLYDGTGAPGRRADVGLRGGLVAEVGDLSAAETRETLDATARCVSPGFVDAHSHSDAYLLVEPSAPSKIFQGITTEVVGNCGASAAPRHGPARMPSDWQDKPLPGRWSSVDEYRRLLEQVRPAPNVVMLVGHNNVRASVMGYEDRAPTPDERSAMERLLDQALAEGGAGLSTGLIYSPGMFAAREEVVALARVAARRGGIYTSHMRSEGGRLLEAIDETLDVGRRAGVRVEISHLKTSGSPNWGKIDAALERIDAARDQGVQVAADRYPYTASSTDLDVILPPWAAAGGRDEMLARLRDKATRARIREDLLARRETAEWGRIAIGSTHRAENRRFQGQPLADVAVALGMEPVDAALHLMDTDELSTGAIFFGMSESNLWRILAQPWVMLGSDASLRAPEGPLSHDHPHPRNYGAFPRFLRAALDGRTVPVEEAVRKMTSLAADHFGLRGRGRIVPGAHADVLVWDPRGVRDRSDFARPHQLADGMNAVIVNGIVTLLDGRLTGRRAGAWLA